MRRLLAIGALTVAAIGFAPPADAHALLRSSDPADGAVLDAPPADVAITFSERTEPDLSEIRVLDDDGRSYELGTPEQDPDDPLTLVTEVEGLDEGVYTVAWRAFSAVDGHLTGGAFAFGIGVDPDDVVPAEDIEASEPPLAPDEAAGRWILYAGLGLLVGGAWVGTLAFPVPPAAVRRLTWAGAGGGALGVVVLGAAQQAAADAPLGRLLTTDIGQALTGRAGAVVAAVAALIVAQRAPKLEGIALPAAGAAAAGAMLVHASAGHAATGPLASVNIALHWVHFLAAAVWAGGLAALLAGLRGAPSDEKATAVRRFSGVALMAFAVVVGTGGGRALREVESWSQLVETPYGWMILTKVGLVGVIAVLAARNRYRHVPRAGGALAGLRRVSRGELAVTVAVLAAAAVLASLTPARYAVEAAERERITVSATDFAGSVEVTLEAAPGTPGPNAFLVRTTEPDTGDPVPAGGITARFRLPGALDIPERSLTFERREEGLWEASGSQLGVPGVWEVVIVVERGARSVEVPLQVGTRCLSDPQPGAPDGPVLHTTDLGGGRSLLAYLEAGEPGGRHAAHFTFFDEDGEELPVGEVELSAFAPDHGVVEMEPQPLSPGHYVGRAELDAGWWRIEAAVTDADDERVVACFEEEVR